MSRPKQRTVSVAVAAATLGIHPQSLYAAIRSGESPVPFIRVVKRILIPATALERVVDGRPAIPDTSYDEIADVLVDEAARSNEGGDAA